MEAVAATDPGCEAGKCAGPPLWGGIYMVKRLRFSQIEANFHFSLLFVWLRVKLVKR